MKMSRDRIEELEKEIVELKRRWPAHSVPQAMMEQLDELEMELQKAQMEQDGTGSQSEIYSQPFHLQAIGHVENEFVEPASPELIRSVESQIILDPALLEGLRGLEPGQQLLVIFYFHRSTGFDLLQYPRGDRSRPLRGVFALRSPRRPNPIGATIVELVSIEGNILHVRGLDAIHGTPVLDLKPG
jgi:tRNA (adenine37-N6)-methyltransferase